MLGILHGHLLLKILEPLINLLNKKTQHIALSVACNTIADQGPTKHPINWAMQEEGVAWSSQPAFSARRLGTWRTCLRRSTSSLHECLNSPRSSSTAGKTGGAAPRTGGGGGGAGAASSSPRYSGSSSSTSPPNRASNEKSPCAAVPQGDDETASRRRQPNRRKKGKPTLKSSRSRVRGSAAAGSAGVGMAAGEAGGDLGIPFPFSCRRWRRASEWNAGGVPSVCSIWSGVGAGGRVPCRGGRDEKCRAERKNLLQLQPR